MLRFLWVVFLVVCPILGQFPVLTRSLVETPSVARGANGQLWVGAAYDVLRFDGQGKLLWKAELPQDAVIVGIGVDGSGRTVAAAASLEKGYLARVDAAGKLVQRIEIAGLPTAIAVDEAGNSYVAGRAKDGFAGTPGTLRPVFVERECSERGGRVFACDDAFVSKFDGEGRLVWSTLLGGGAEDAAYAIRLARDGAIWVAGETQSLNFPVTTDGAQKVYGGGDYLGPFSYGDGFVARINASATKLEYGSYLGGKRWDRVTAIEVTSNGLAIGGVTDSLDFPVTAGALQMTNSVVGVAMPELESESFLGMIGLDGTLRYATYFGESGRQRMVGIEAGNGTQWLASVFGTKDLCFLVLDTGGSVSVKLSCRQSQLRGPFRAVGSEAEWLYVGATLPGRVVNSSGYLQIQRMIGASPDSGMGLRTYWTDIDPGYRPVLARGAWATFSLPGFVGAASNLLVVLDGEQLRVEEAEGGGFRFLTPVGKAVGTYTFQLATPFFSSGITAVDVAPRWPGLASAAVNQDGSVNSEQNPAARGTVVSLFGTGLGLDGNGLPEVYVAAGPPTFGAGMEVLFAGTVGVGLQQLNVRVPEAANVGHVQVRLVFREGTQFRLSNLARIWVR